MQQIKIFLLLAGSDEQLIERNLKHIVNFLRRKLLQVPSNLPAAPASNVNPTDETPEIPFNPSSGAYPAIPNAKNKQFPTPLPPPGDNPKQQSPDKPNPNASRTPTNQSAYWRTMIYIYVVPGVAFLITVAAAMLFMCRKPGQPTIGPWKTGLSGQLQKAFVTGT